MPEKSRDSQEIEVTDVEPGWFEDELEAIRTDEEIIYKNTIQEETQRTDELTRRVSEAVPQIAPILDWDLSNMGLPIGILNAQEYKNGIIFQIFTKTGITNTDLQALILETMKDKTY